MKPSPVIQEYVSRSAIALKHTTPELWSMMEPWRKNLVKWHVKHGDPVSTAVSHVFIWGYDPFGITLYSDYPTISDLGWY